MDTRATRKNVIEALDQMQLYGVIARYADPISPANRWAIWTGENSTLMHLIGPEVIAMNTGVCAALRAVRAGRSVQHLGAFLSAENAARRAAAPAAFEVVGEFVYEDSGRR